MKSKLTALSDRICRIEYGGLYVDIIATSNGLIRVGSMPDITKFLKEHGIREESVVLPEWSVSMAGDNRTGEEFVLWRSQLQSGIPRQYIGLHHNINRAQYNLDCIFPYYFDSDNLSIVKMNWLDTWFRPHPADPNFCFGDVEVCCSENTIVINDEQKTLYNSHDWAPLAGADASIDALLADLPRDNEKRDCLEILPIGCGNGFSGTAANTLVRFADHVIWIDPCGYPAHTLANRNIHWDDVTHFLFTHNHEDHVQGFTACIQRARKYKRKIHILIAENVYTLLQELYSPIFPDLKEHVDITFLTPGKGLQLGPVYIESRWNHHILPYGTLGLKFTAGGKCFGYSGDTKYDESINDILKREELRAEWFASCDLIFHEIDFNSKDSVHSYWKQVESLQRKVSGLVLGYHIETTEEGLFPLAQEGFRYLLEKDIQIIPA